MIFFSLKNKKKHAKVKSMKAQWHEVDDFHEDLKLKTRLTKWVSRGERKTMGTIVIQEWYSVVYDNEGKKSQGTSKTNFYVFRNGDQNI